MAIISEKQLMFRRFLQTLDDSEQARYPLMRTYLERHIDLDEDSHAPMGRELMKTICGTDNLKWTQAVDVTCHSLRMRSSLWDGVMEVIRSLVRTEGVSAIVATHDPLLLDVADTVVELRDGQVVSQGSNGAP